MKCLVDQNIPFGRELFGALGEVTLTDGRDVGEGSCGLGDYDVLAVRSVTRVTPALIDRAGRCRVIATATIGTDHIDLAHVRRVNTAGQRHITVISAPGSNADSVADYVWYALGHLTRGAGEPLRGRSLGIIGYGNCGSRVARRARGFGMRVLRHDPPLAERERGFDSDALEDVLRADFVSLHVPLTGEEESRYPTWHMIGPAELGAMRRDAHLLNTSRGAVVDSGALARALEEGDIAGAVLDVYEGEPEPPKELIRLPALATPHVAGYAIEGRRRGAAVIYEGTCRALDVTPVDTSEIMMRGFEPPQGRRVKFDGSGGKAVAADRAVRALLRATYDIEATSDELKDTLDQPERGTLFDRMRREHRRHELAVYRVGFDESVPEPLRRGIAQRLEEFGVTMVQQEAHYVLHTR